jgi:succinate dehydrogenase hydrophobic anchor subunit
VEAYGKDVLTRFYELRMFYVILLVVVAYHAFNGLRIITVELGRMRLSNVFYVVMILAVAYGLFLLFSI